MCYKCIFNTRWRSLSSQGYGFSSGHVWMWESDYKESWALKNWCFWTVVLEKTLESPLDCKEIQPVHPKGDQSWMFLGRTDVEAETQILWPPHAKSWLIGKDPDAGERVTGRMARGLQREEIACKCQTFLSLLSSRRKQTSNIFPSLYKFKRRFLLKYCVAIMTPGFTWS